MNAIKRDRRTSIRASSDILKLADEIGAKRGYSRADLFEMGVLLMDDNTEEEITANHVYDEMIRRFEQLDKKLNMIHEELISEINLLKSKKTDKKEMNYTAEDVRMVTESIIETIEKREFWIKHGKLLDPMGKDFFDTKSRQYKVPVDIIREELAKKGYTTEKLAELNINPEGRWEGLRELKKETMV